MEKRVQRLKKIALKGTELLKFPKGGFDMSLRKIIMK